MDPMDWMLLFADDEGPPFARGLRRLPSAHDEGSSSDSSIRSRSREPRPRPGSQAGHGAGSTVLDFGCHEGRTYRDVASHEPGYVRWVLTVRRPQGRLAAFQRYLRFTPVDDIDSAESGDFLSESFESDEDGDADSRHAGGNAAAGEPRQRVPTSEMQRLLHGLPRIAFSAAMFSGEPHPAACPICMEDFISSACPAPFGGASREPTGSGEATAGGELAAGAAGPSRNGGAELEIILTPCLHVFHAACLTNWLARPSAARACPTCRWDIGDDGASQALGCCAQAARQSSQSDPSRPQTIRDLLAVRGGSPVVHVLSDSDSN